MLEGKSKENYKLGEKLESVPLVDFLSKNLQITVWISPARLWIGAKTVKVIYYQTEPSNSAQTDVYIYIILLVSSR